LLGGLTFFLPCGFTQAMQLYAISSGSVLTGALTMGVFALGTAPGLLGIGGLTSVIKGAFAKPFFKFVGLMVIGLSLFNISNGMNLTGLSLPTFASASAKSIDKISDPNVVLVNGKQVVKMTQRFNGYSPRSFTIQKGIPVKWIVTSTDVNTCASSIYSSQLNIRKSLKLGENIIEFAKEIPKTTITIPLISQLVKAGTSVGANYIEAIASPTTKDFRKFLSYSLKSANESKYWLALIKFSRINDGVELEWLLKETIEISNMLGKSVSTMYKNKNEK